MCEIGVAMLSGLYTGIIGAGIAVAGWFFVQRSNLDRDRKKRLEDSRVQFLLEAYRRLESTSNRKPSEMTENQKIEFESAIADIQLLGTQAEINTLGAFLKKYNVLSHDIPDKSDITPVLNLLRTKLRQESNLEVVPEDIMFFRFKREQKAEPAQ